MSSRLMSRAKRSRRRQRLLCSVVERSCCLSATACSAQERREGQVFGASRGTALRSHFHCRMRLAGTLDSEYARRGISILAADTEVQCAAISQATIIIPDTSTIVRPWVSSQRRAWRRALRPCGDEKLSASRPARPPSVRSIAPPWRKGRLNGLRSSLVLMAQIDAIVVNFGRYD
jgi:hypothetical protein